ncbi:MAG: hypothetical protein J5J00_09340 [Deltaproteobacteria bacterium]|nr:hypothetical protein [Deltaproteobacteria bacterium]
MISIRPQSGYDLAKDSEGKVMKRANVYLIVLVLLMPACGGSGRSLQGKYSVTDVNILANDIEVGESVRVEVFFETKTEGDGTPDGVDLVVRIPAELEYVSGTSAIYDGDTNNSDRYTPQLITECETGESYLIYEFQDFDLFNREVGGAGNFGIRLEARGVSPVAATFVGATAGDREGFECGEQFAAEENEAVQVLP